MGLTVRLGLWVVIMSFFEISDAEPWHAPDTLLEATAPVKLSCCELVSNDLVCLCDSYNFVKQIKSGISRTHFAPTYPELNIVLQESQRIVKVHRVSLSHIQYLASSRECQIRWNLKGDSKGVMTPFVQDTNYVSRNFAQ